MNHRAKEITWQRKSHGKRNIEVKSQQIAFTQSPSVSNNPKIPTYYLIFAETREITWQEKSHGKKTNGKGEKESEASDGNSCCSVRAVLLAIGDRGRSVGGRGRVGQIAQIGVGQIAQIGVGRVGQIGRVLGD